MNDKIEKALLALDPENNDHWTSDNQPRLDVMKAAVGSDITRADIQVVSKTFNRKNPVIGNETPTETQAPAPVVSSPATEPVTVPVTQTVPEESPEPVVAKLDGEAAIVTELTTATELMYVAQARFKKAQAAMDEIIAKKEKASKAETFSNTVKQYQAAQHKQRADRMGASKALAEAAKTMEIKG